MELDEETENRLASELSAKIRELTREFCLAHKQVPPRAYVAVHLHLAAYHAIVAHGVDAKEFADWAEGAADCVYVEAMAEREEILKRKREKLQ